MYYFIFLQAIFFIFLIINYFKKILYRWNKVNDESCKEIGTDLSLMSTLQFLKIDLG